MRFIAKMLKKRLGELLIDEGLVTSDQVVDALKEQKKTGRPIGEILVSYGVVSEWDIAWTLSNQFQLPFLNASKYFISPDVRELFTPETLHRLQCIPLDRFENILILAVADILNHKKFEELEAATGCEMFLYVGLPSEIQQVLNKEFPLDGLQQRGIKDQKIPQDAEAQLEAAAKGEWEKLFDAANENVLSDIRPQQSEDIAD